MDAGLVVGQLLADVRPRRETQVVVGGDHQHAHGVFVAGRRDVPEDLLEHLRVHRVARVLTLQAQQRDARLVD